MRCEFLNDTSMKKLFIAISMIAVCGIASAANAPAKSEYQSPPPERMGACIFSPCLMRTICDPRFGDSNFAANYLYALELPCIMKELLPPKPNKDRQGPPPPAGGRR